MRTIRPHDLTSSTRLLLIEHRDHESAFKRSLRARVGDEAFMAWFQSLHFVKAERRTIHFSVPTAFLQQWIVGRYADVMLDACKAEWPQVWRFRVHIRSCVLKVMTAPKWIALAAPIIRWVPDPEIQTISEQLPLPGTVLIKKIQYTVAAAYGVTRTDLISQRRTANVVLPRQKAMFLAKVLTLRSLPEIGRRFGGRDHTTVLHAVRKIENLAANDPVVAEEIEALKRQLQE